MIDTAQLIQRNVVNFSYIGSNIKGLINGSTICYNEKADGLPASPSRSYGRRPEAWSAITFIMAALSDVGVMSDRAGYDLPHSNALKTI